MSEHVHAPYLLAGMWLTSFIFLAWLFSYELADILAEGYLSFWYNTEATIATVVGLGSSELTVFLIFDTPPVRAAGVIEAVALTVAFIIVSQVVFVLIRVYGWRLLDRPNVDPGVEDPS